MMLLITNDGIYCQEWETNEKDKFATPLQKGIHHYYADSVLFSDDLSVGGFFNTMYKYKEIIEHDFVSYIRCSNLQPFYDHLNKSSEYVFSNYHGIIIKHSSSISIHKIDGVRRNYVNTWDHLIGYNNTDANIVPMMGISFDKKLPLKLDVNYNLVQINPLDKDVVLATNLVHHYTLHDIISLMFYEMTFIDDFDNENDDYDCDEIKPVDQLIKRELEETILDKQNQLELAKAKEQYEKCAYLQEEINRLETSLKSGF